MTKHYIEFIENTIIYSCIWSTSVSIFCKLEGDTLPILIKMVFFGGGGRSSPHYESNKKNTPAMFGSVSMDGCLVLLLIFQYFNFFQNLGPPSPPRLSLLKYFPFQNFKN